MRSARPRLRLTAEAGLAPRPGTHWRRRDAETSLADIEQQSAALDLAFISNQCIFFQAVLASCSRRRRAAADALRRCLPAQLQLGHIDFLCQEFAQWPKMAVKALADDELAEWRSDIVAALAHSAKSVPLFIELMSSAGAPLQALIVDACARHAPSAVAQALLEWTRKHGSARQLRSLRRALDLRAAAAPSRPPSSLRESARC